MTPTPLLSSHQSKQEETLGETSCDVSFASSACIDDILEFVDPDAVDFEPLLISGTGKILSYHSASYHHEYEGSVISGNSSVATPVTRNNANHERDASLYQHLSKKTASCSSPRVFQLLSLLFLLAFLVVGGLWLFAIDSDAYSQQRLQTTVTKERVTGDSIDRNMEYQSVPNNIILQQHIMDVNVAAFEASASKVAFWEPYLDHSGTPLNEELVEHLMSIMSLCFGRSIYKLQKEPTNSYRLDQVESIHQPQIQGQNSSLAAVSTGQQTSPSTDIPMAVFTPDFKHAAIELFDHFHRGAFITILHDPIDVYLQQYTKQKRSTEFRVPENGDNLLVRYLSGIESESRRVNSGDYDVAKQVLRSKFVIGTCDHPTETLRRLVKMIGTNGVLARVGDQCTKERQSWNQGCRKMKEVGHQNQRNRHNLQILRLLKSEHHYDILLYEESKNLFREQNKLFHSA